MFLLTLVAGRFASNYNNNVNKYNRQCTGCLVVSLQLWCWPAQGIKSFRSETKTRQSKTNTSFLRWDNKSCLGSVITITSHDLTKYPKRSLLWQSLLTVYYYYKCTTPTLKFQFSRNHFIHIYIFKIYMYILITLSVDALHVHFLSIRGVTKQCECVFLPLAVPICSAAMLLC